MLAIEHYLQLRERPKDLVVMYQKWRDLSFLHYSLDPAELRSMVPNELEVDTFPDDNGHERAWVGLIPFWMTDVRPRFLPSLPGLNTFPETNLRTYVHLDGQRPGVWFFSLEAANRIACAVARQSVGLPYHWATMAFERKNSARAYSSKRADASKAVCKVTATAGEELGSADPGTLEFFLLERYVLYTRTRRKLLTVQVHHRPYPLNALTPKHCEENLTTRAGLPKFPWQHAIFSSGVNVEIYLPHKAPHPEAQGSAHTEQ
jgi:uncharacterized protein